MRTYSELMSKSWRLGSLFGFPVELNLSFVLLLALVFLAFGGIAGVGLVLLVFASVLLHELGHIMGLDHVHDPDQLMYSGRHPNVFLHDYGTGDLEGLRRLGMDAGCLA